MIPLISIPLICFQVYYFVLITPTFEFKIFPQSTLIKVTLILDLYCVMTLKAFNKITLLSAIITLKGIPTHLTFRITIAAMS